MKKLIVLFTLILSSVCFANGDLYFKVTNDQGLTQTEYGESRNIYTNVLDNKDDSLEFYYYMPITKNEWTTFHNTLMKLIKKEWKNSELKFKYLKAINKSYKYFKESKLDKIEIYVSENVEDPMFVVGKNKLVTYSKSGIKFYDIKSRTENFSSKMNFKIEYKLEKPSKNNNINWEKKSSLSKAKTEKTHTAQEVLPGPCNAYYCF